MADVPSFDRFFIGGEWVKPSSSETFTVVSPYTEEVLGTAPAAQEADIDAAVAAARDAVENGPWARMSGVERAEGMRRLHDVFIAKSNDLAELITAEVGATLLFSHFGQVGAAGMVLDYFCNLTK